MCRRDAGGGRFQTWKGNQWQTGMLGFFGFFQSHFFFPFSVLAESNLYFHTLVWWRLVSLTWKYLRLQEINCVNNAAVAELMRGLRSQLSELIVGLAGSDIVPMSLGLSHSLSRYKLKFSPDKVSCNPCLLWVQICLWRSFSSCVTSFQTDS
jgi:hypothetical protein